MSRIDELIGELTPGGVRHVALSEIACYSPTRVDASELDATSFVGVDNLVSNKRGRIDASYLPNTARLTAYEPGDILIGNIRPYLKKVWCATRSGGCSGDVLALRIRPNLTHEFDSKFLYHLLSSDRFFAYSMQHAKGAKMPRGNKVAILNYRIPVPPLQVQQEIVRILSQFMELEEQLDAELIARRAQYTHYRDSLLTFADAETVNWVTLTSICEIYDGTHQTPRYTDEGVKFVSVENIDDLRASQKYISAEDFESQYKAKPRTGDLLMTRIGRIGACALVPNDDPLAYYVTLALIRPRDGTVSANYLKHIIESRVGVSELRRRTLVRAVPIKINLGDIGRISIPIPGPAEQAQIVSFLDKFDALVSDPSSGIPRELASRRTQYEYYRDRLTTFAEAAS